jgi:serine/threonine-protein kinase
VEGLEPGEPVPVAIGELVDGKYRVEKFLGVGGMGIVCSALHEALKQHVALKIMRKSRMTKESADRFLFEARAAVRLKSNHVAKVLDVGTLPNKLPYMVMELLEGEDLDDVLDRRGALPVEEAIDVVLQACDAISEAHEAKIVHRDLKPSNLFVTKRRDGRPLIKVLDFGISKLTVLDEKADEATKRVVTHESTVMGSPSYMSPEQVRADKDVDQRADIWSLGAILYELLTGREPFGSDDPMKVFSRVLEEEPEPLEVLRPDLAPGLAEVVMQCLQKKRHKRFDDVDALVKALEGFGAKRITSIPPPPSRESMRVEVDLAAIMKKKPSAETFVIPDRRTGSRRKKRSRGLAVFLVLTLAAVGGGLWAKKTGRLERAALWAGLISPRAGKAPEAAAPPPPPAAVATASAAPEPAIAPSVSVAAATTMPEPKPSATAPRGRRPRGARGSSLTTAPPVDDTPEPKPAPAASAAPPPPAPAPADSAKYRRTDW